MPEQKRIFVVDDDEIVLESLKTLLIMSDFEVKVATDSRDVFSMIKSFKPHLILLDLLMPHIGGLEICEMLNNDKETQGIPVIIISALGDYTDIATSYRLGVVGYITKPYQFPLLLKEIQKAIVSKEGGQRL